MRAILRAISATCLVWAAQQAAGVSPARAQAGSLGGYGATVAAPDAGMGTGGVIPYAGRFGGFMPSRMGGGSSLAFTRRGPSTGSTRAPLGLDSMSGGTGKSVGMRRGFGTAGPMSPMGGIGQRRPRPGMGGRGVMPPSFAYPFRQPPSPASPSSTGSGMSM